MHDNFWVKINKSGIFYSIEKYYLDDARIIYCQKKKTITKLGARRCAKRFINKKIIQQYIKETL
jgi:hypothetical protein